MTEVYTPDSFVIIEIDMSNVAPEHPKTYKILAGWSGGYLDGTLWRLNSGITHVTFDMEAISVYGSSGSRYDVYMYQYGLRMATAPTWSIISAAYPDKVRLLTEDEALEYLDSIAREAEGG